MTDENIRVTAIIVSEEDVISFAELCQGCALAAEQVITMVEYGIIEPMQESRVVSHWQFRADCVPRVQTALRLQRDLKINLSGAALALDLLDEVKSLRQLVTALQRER